MMKCKHTEEKFLDLLETELPNAKPLDTDLLERMLAIKHKAEDMEFVRGTKFKSEEFKSLLSKGSNILAKEMEAKRFAEDFYSENAHSYEKFGMTTEMLEGLPLPHKDKPVEKMGNLEQYLLFEE